MDDLRKKSVDEQVGGKAENLKGKFKEGVGKLTGDKELEAEGQVDQGEGKVRDKVGKTGRAISDMADRAKDKLSGND
ncbi:MAG: CsbD family protein [Bacteroidales bacterium]